MVLPEQLPEHLQDMAMRIHRYRAPWKFVDEIPETRLAFEYIWVDKEGRVSLGDLTTEPDMVDAFSLFGFACSLYEVEARANSLIGVLGIREKGEGHDPAH